MDKGQTGFVPKLGCHVNIIELLRKIEKVKKRRGRLYRGINRQPKFKKSSMIFIDYSSAYNTVDRELIY